ncbi:MAG: Phytochrome-like protein cph2 [Candidatus Omnitrophica bacterium ADurb.Bin314]|jgi:diguanylate cyclase (GGDEF)-like protein|nr:MAG: Phytochrome-like protein cph2 [Candidatus Omnitrophica bacterium ADurb.Bin314]HOE69014.1 GGDEF domain-containing protein [Candidatus Omnitrophota bacterium]HPW64850.1 GGDEF domain-containing protein [Candidatus Omnitrophota bacterium]
MRGSLLILAAQLVLGFFILCISKELVLPYYLLAPLMLLPSFYFYRDSARKSLLVSLFVAVLFNLRFVFVDPHPRFFSFLLLQALFFIVLCLYSRELRETIRQADEKKNEVRKNLDNLQAKFQTRLTSLKHLELQVSSLMNLFEIARDFSECMDFATLTEFLLKKLRDELSFERMRIFLFPAPTDPVEPGTVKVYDMVANGVTETERVLSDQEKTDFGRMRAEKNMVKNDSSWHFPIFEAAELGAVFSIEGVKDEDLARVEVLSAYLVLLIKKIKLYETVRKLAIVDELTQVFVRHHFSERLEEEVERSVRFRLPLAVLMLDIDHFKRYNDDFGHLVGDATLKEVADLLKKSLRRVDLVGRYGGEEFLVAMPETKLENAVEVAERIRSSIARHDFQVYNDKTRVTVSQGLVVFDAAKLANPERADFSKIAAELVHQADEAMYQAKDEGRNRVCIYKESKKTL